MSTVHDLAAVNGWKLLLLALLGGYLVSKAGGALGEVLHGSPPLVSVKTGDVHAPDATMAPPAASAPPVKVSGVAGLEPGEVDDLAQVFASTYGPLPPEVVAGLPGVSSEGGIQVGGHPAAWAAGIVAAAAAVGLIAWRMHPGGLPAVAAHVDPVEVKPIAVSPIAIQPDLSKAKIPPVDLSQILPGMGGGAPGKGGAPAPAALPAQAQRLLGGLTQFLNGGGAAS